MLSVIWNAAVSGSKLNQIAIPMTNTTRLTARAIPFMRVCRSFGTTAIASAPRTGMRMVQESQWAQMEPKNVRSCPFIRCSVLYPFPCTIRPVAGS